MKIAETISTHLGEFFKANLDRFDGTWNAFIKVRVSMDITKPLRKIVKIKPAGGDCIWLECKYKRLPTFCFVCGRIGHAEKYCPMQFNTKNAELEKAYGPELCATATRGLSEGNRWLLSQLPSRLKQAARSVAREPN